MQQIELELAGGGVLTVSLRASLDAMPAVKERPLVLVVPGGGYDHVSPREGDPVALQFAAAGYHTAVLTYSVGEGAQNYQPLRQLNEALALLRQNAGEWHILPDKIAKTLTDNERIQWFASKYASAKDAFFIGRGLDYAISMEGSLKLKEISYIHSEAYAAGELKHGTISLIEDGVLVVAVATQPELFEKEVSNMVEVRSRGASLFGLTTYGQYAIEDTVNFTVYVPRTDPLLTTSLAVVPLQLLAYYISCAKGLDVDKPRNLAKSVTVE